MAIRYEIPLVGAQKGPTCWYYAAKMLLRFHELIGKDQHLESEWQALHLVRQTVTRLAREGRPHGTTQAIAAGLTQRMNREPDGEARARLRDARKKIAESASAQRFDLLDAFFADSVRPVPLGGRSLDAAFVADTLRAFGPVYSSIHRLGDTLENDYVEDPLSPGKYVYKIEKKCREGGLHAVVITGVDDSENVYYRDPNAPHRDTMVAWPTLLRVLNSPGGSLGDNLFGAVRCQDCEHLARKQQIA